MSIAFGTGPPECVLEPEQNDGLKQTVKEITVNQKEAEDRKRQIEHHMKVEHEDAEQKVHNLRQETEIQPKFEAYRFRFIGMMIRLESM